MIDDSPSGMAYNRFTNLDGIEDRVIFYLLSEQGKTPDELEKVHEIWRILYYNDLNALIDDGEHPLPAYSDIINLISNDNLDQQNKRIFRSPRLDSAWAEQCSILKIYVDSIVPENHVLATVNIGIDVIVHEKIINLAVPDDGKNVYIDKVNNVTYTINTKSRVTTLTADILYLLNGASLQGIGKAIYSRQNSNYNQSQYGLWSNVAYEGMKNVIGIKMSGVS